MRGPADADTIATVVDAFQHAPMSETDRMLVQVLIDNPDASSEQLTEAMGWKDQAWQLHFGKMCERREHLLSPAPFEPKRNAPFYSGILADFDKDTRGFTLKTRGRRSLRPTRAACARLAMNLHKEISFEAEVCDWLGAHGWLYESGDAERYDRARALYPPDLVAWVQASQPKAWEAAGEQPRRLLDERPARPRAQATRRPGHARRAAAWRRDDRAQAAAHRSHSSVRRWP